MERQKQTVKARVVRDDIFLIRNSLRKWRLARLVSRGSGYTNIRWRRYWSNQH